MYIDNLSIAGALIAAAYGLLPLLFGRELLHVTEEATERDSPRAAAPSTSKQPAAEPAEGALHARRCPLALR
jgi:hypothetical protein